MKVIGSGLIAQAFKKFEQGFPDVCIYAAGVSNSACVDENEFARERTRLCRAMEETPAPYSIIYFGTCSVADSDVLDTVYVKHKLEMESLVAGRENYLICRLPQLAGKTPNPNTLLNYLYARISRSEAFTLWGNAERNIIDVEDVARIVNELLSERDLQNAIVNIANPVNYSIYEIVKRMEEVVGKRAIFNISARGKHYSIDTVVLQRMAMRVGIEFDKDYLGRVLDKYYGEAGCRW